MFTYTEFTKYYETFDSIINNTLKTFYKRPLPLKEKIPDNIFFHYSYT